MVEAIEAAPQQKGRGVSSKEHWICALLVFLLEVTFIRLLAGHKCTFICSDSEHTGIFGQSVRVSCSLSDGTLLKNLTWHKGGIPIANSSLYSIYKDENTFVLLINKLSVADVGNYTCSGIEQIMGNHVYSETTLNGSKPTAKSGMYLCSS